MSDNFSGSPIAINLTPFTITPLRCKVSYACTGVAKEGSATSSIDCDSLTFDGGVNDDDLELSFTASSTEYENGDFTPGVYTITITGTADGSS